MNVNIVKAYLILLVIIDHNDMSRSYIGSFLDGFTFHVVGFFSLYYMNQEYDKQSFRSLLFKQGVRYLYPYLFFVITLSFVVYLTGFFELSAHAWTTLQALFTGNYLLLKQSTNMYLLWFLPAFVSFVFLEKSYKTYAAKFPIKMFLCLLALFLYIPFVPDFIQSALPLGVLTACYILLLTVVIKYLYLGLISKLDVYLSIALVLLVFIFIKAIQIQLNLIQEVGFLQVTSIEEPIPLIVNALESVVGVLLVYVVSSVNFGRFMEWMGKYSLQVYLFHAFIALFVYKVLSTFFNDLSLYVWLISIMGTALISTIISLKAMNNRVLLRYLFPKDVNVLLWGTKGKTL